MSLSNIEIEGLISALETALGSGELTVEYQGRRFTYRSTDDLVKAISYFRSRLTASDGYAPAPESARRTTYAAFEDD